MLISASLIYGKSRANVGSEFRIENFDMALGQGTVELENGWKLALPL